MPVVSIRAESSGNMVMLEDNYYDFKNNTMFLITNETTRLVSQMEWHGDTLYITYFKGIEPFIYIKKFWPINNTFSNEHLVVNAGTNSFDHMMSDFDIDEDGYIHITWSMHNGHPGGFGMKYRCSLYPEDITQWTEIETISDTAASYARILTNGSFIYLFNRPGSHGSGYHMWYRERNSSKWNEKAITTTSGLSTYNTYANIGEFFNIGKNLVCPWVHYYRDEVDNCPVNLTYSLYNLSTEDWWYANGTKISDVMPYDQVAGDHLVRADITDCDLCMGFPTLNSLNEPLIIFSDPRENPSRYSRAIFNSSSESWNIDVLNFSWDWNKMFWNIGIVNDIHPIIDDNGDIVFCGQYSDEAGREYRGNYTQDVIVMRSEDNGYTWSFENLTVNNKFDKVSQCKYSNGYWAFSWKQGKVDWENDGAPVPDNNNDNALLYVIKIFEPPIANDDEITVDKNSLDNEIDALANDKAAGGIGLRIISITEPTYGFFSTDGEKIYYTPETGYFGIDNFTYKIEDENGEVDKASIKVTISEVKDFSFEHKWTSYNGYAGRSARAADLNGDGYKEIIKNYQGGVSALWGTNGTEIWNYSDGSIWSESVVEMADLNNDGFPEVLVTLRDVEAEAGLLVLHGNNGSLYWRRNDLGGNEMPAQPVVFDSDNDGFPTIYTASRTEIQGETAKVCSLTYDGQMNCYSDNLWWTCWGGISIMDYDNDGHFELYLGDNDPTTPGDWIKSFWAENLTLRWKVRRYSDPYLEGSAGFQNLIDVTGDGIKDVVCMTRNRYQTGRFGFAILSPEDGSIIRMSPRDLCTYGPYVIYDIDYDGHLEAIGCADEYDNSNYLTVFDLVDWSLDADIYIPDGSRYSPTVGEVTGDGLMDIIVPDGNYLRIFNHTFDEIALLPLDGSDGGKPYNDPLVPCVTDIDNDGLNEIIVTRWSGHVVVYDTDGISPSGGVRSGMIHYSEYRLGAAEYVTIITFKDEQPIRGSTVQSLNPTLSVNVTNYQDELMNITFRTNASGSWQDIGSYTNVGSGRYSMTPSNMDSVGTVYWWSVNATDGYTWNNMTYSFTISLVAPVVSDENPSDGATAVSVSLSELTFNLTDYQGDLMNYTVETSPDIGSESGNGEGNGTKAVAVHNLEGETTYTWYVNVTDGSHSDNMSYYFTTEIDRPLISNERPVNGVAHVELNPTLQCSIVDLQGDSVNWTIRSNASGGWTDLESGILSTGNGTVSAVSSFMDNLSTSYWWSINTTDSRSGDWVNKSFSFTTELITVFDPFDEGCKYRKAITINHTKVADNLTSFPLLIDIVDVDLKNHSQQDGGDILFMNGNGTATRLNHEVEYYNHSSGHLVAWVNITQLSMTEDTILYMYYGNAISVNYEYPEGVWNSEYIMVHHLDETSGIHYDSTINDNDGVPYGEITQNTTGIIDGADSFDGIDDHVDLPKDNMTSGLSELTLEFWINADEWNSTNTIWDEYSGTYWQNSIRCDKWYTRDNSTGSTGSRNNDLLLPTITTGEWHHLAFVYSVSQNLKAIYLDGEFNTSTNTSIGPLTNARAGACIGCAGDGNNFDGMIDEVRLSHAVYSPEWIATEYANQNNSNSFYSIGNEEQNDATPPCINDVQATPPSTLQNGYINITCNVTDNTGVDIVKVNISGPAGFTSVNVTMMGNNIYYYNNTYNISGTYDYFIWANDTSGNINMSSVGQFNITGITEQKYVISLHGNWSKISIPFNKSVNKIDFVVYYNATNYSWNDAVSEGIILGFIYDWNRNSQLYELTDTLVPGSGYNVYAYYDCELRIEIGNIESDKLITDLLIEWNIVGLPHNESTPKENLIVEYEGVDYNWTQATTNDNPTGGPIILGFIYDWNRSSQIYELTDTLVPGYGYQMYAYYNCTLKRQV